MKLTKIIVSPLNNNFIFKDNKYLLGKTNKDSDEFDILLFGNRNIKEISIPSNIKIISPYAFDHCEKLRKVEIPPNSNLQMIKKNAFSYTKIQEIFIPSKVLKIGKNAFSECIELKKVEFAPNSNLQIIGHFAFKKSNIECISIPSKVAAIYETTFWQCKNLRNIEIPRISILQTTYTPPDEFYTCENLQIIEVLKKSELDSFPCSAFSIYSNFIIMIPSSSSNS